MNKDYANMLDFLARVDSCRRNVERAAKAENYHSAAHLALELSAEAQRLSDALETLALERTRR